MIATLVNAAAALLGGTLGLLLRGRIGQKYQDAVTVSVGLVTFILGIGMALGGGTLLLVIPALILGGLAGTALNIEGAILRTGEALRRLVSPKEEGASFARGFLDASVLYCVGPMTVVGSLEAGLRGDFSVLFTKSALDGFMGVILAATLGPGVLGAAVSVLVVQGALTLLAGLLAPLATEGILAELGALGGYLILMIGLNLLKLKSIKTADFLPAILLVVLFAWARDFFGLGGVFAR